MTTETTTQPTISEAMTPSDLQAACKALATIVGKDAYAIAMVSDHKYLNESCATLTLRSGNGRGDPEAFHAKSWPEAFAAAYAWLSTSAQVRRNTLIKRMALKVIEITDEHGSCPEARLRAADFTAAEISEFHEAACVRAGEMAGNVPFSVVMETANV